MCASYIFSLYSISFAQILLRSWLQDKNVSDTFVCTSVLTLCPSLKHQQVVLWPSFSSGTKLGYYYVLYFIRGKDLLFLLS